MSFHARNLKTNQPGTTRTWEDNVTTAPQHVNAPIEVNILDATQWRAAVQRALGDLRLSYDDLAEQARKRDFVSPEARKLWLAIGGKRP